MNGYEDIINLPHHVSSKRYHMSMSERAAQFAPFAALTGYEEAIKRTEEAVIAERNREKTLPEDSPATK